MNISRDSWHYRLLEWTYHDAPWTYRDVPRTLCPYVDKLVLAMLASPFVAFWRILNEFGQTIIMIESLAILFSAPFGLLLWVDGGNALRLIVVIHVIIWGLASVTLGLRVLVKLIEKRHWRLPQWQWRFPRWKLPSWHWPKLFRREKKVKPPKPVKIIKPKQPSIWWEWLHAKHRKICPILEFNAS